MIRPHNSTKRAPPVSEAGQLPSAVPESARPGLRLDLEHHSPAIPSAEAGCAIEIALRIADQSRVRHLAVRAVAEVVQRRMGPTAVPIRRQLESCATTGLFIATPESEAHDCAGTPVLVRTVNIARGIKNQAGVGEVTGGVNIKVI